MYTCILNTCAGYSGFSLADTHAEHLQNACTLAKVGCGGSSCLTTVLPNTGEAEVREASSAHDDPRVTGSEIRYFTADQVLAIDSTVSTLLHSHADLIDEGQQ